MVKSYYEDRVVCYPKLSLFEEKSTVDFFNLYFVIPIMLEKMAT